MRVRNFLRTTVVAFGFLTPAANSALAKCDPDHIPARFKVSGGEVYDTETNLTWQRCSVGQQWKDDQGCVGTVALLTWDQANKKTGKGWRLPTKDELAGLIRQNCTRPSVNDRVFPNLDPANPWYRSSTVDNPQLAWLVSFDGGAVFNGLRSGPDAVLLVRSGK